MGNAPPSLQDFTLIKSYLDRIKNEHDDINENNIAFYYFVLDLLFGLQDDEIDDAITDTHYLRLMQNKGGGHDRGIDAVYIESDLTPPTIHLFNFKYTDEFKKTTNHFPSAETDKIVNFVSSVLQQDENLNKEVNPVLFSKIKEIWSIFESYNPNFVIHLCCNFYNGLEKSEKERFERAISKFSFFSIQYHLLPDFVSILTHKDRKRIDGKIRAIDKNFFEKSDGDIRALVVDVDARDLLRLVIDNEELRNSVDMENYEDLKNYSLLEDAFEDNVRIYLKMRSKINRNIKMTALSEENHRFFYFNNGITITCDRYSYPKGRRAPIIELKNIQIVNGSQTIHALYEAFLENPEKFEDIDLLCRIYQTNNKDLSLSIAEYTNSQNPVATRDIRSNDFTLKKLESELKALGYFFERKKGQYRDKPKDRRIDAEKAGQALMAFFNKMPAEAKDKKRLIFSEKYDEVFNDNITGQEILLVFKLFNLVEKKKKEAKNDLMKDPSKFEEESFILHATYYVLYLLHELAVKNKVEISLDHLDEIWGFYDKALNLIKECIKLEKEKLKGFKERYNHRMFFKGNKPKKYLDDLLENDALTSRSS